MTLSESIDYIESIGNKYCFVCLQVVGDGIMHVVGYNSSPSITDMTSLVEELSKDEELGMTEHKYLKDYYILRMTLDELRDII